jgi:hypothetical protein
MLAGKLFQTDGPATANDRGLKVNRRVGGMTMRSVEADLKERRPGRSDTQQSPNIVKESCDRFEAEMVCLTT